MYITRYEAVRLTVPIYAASLVKSPKWLSRPYQPIQTPRLRAQGNL